MKKRPEHIGFARYLRRSSTEAERALWRRLSNKQLAGAKFRWQQPLGSYVVDFVCFEHGLIIEVDGDQHNWTKERDDLRTAWLQQRGYRVLRFWNNKILLNIEGVVEKVIDSLGHPNSLPSKGEGKTAS